MVFEVENTNASSIACLPDDDTYELRGRLIGPAADLGGVGGPLRVNVLVHDIGTGAWFWNLRAHRSYDYATKLAKKGETTLVLNRLGYSPSLLRDGRKTCIGAHADMLHQVVQQLRSGTYSYTDPADGTTPAAAKVVTQGHGVGGLIAQVEAADFDDVNGLVLMSWADTGATPLAVRTGVHQARDCIRSDYAPFAQSKSDFRDIMFETAKRGVQRAAAKRQTEDPCGDVASLLTLSSGVDLGASRVEVPVLLLFGGKDKLIRPKARQAQADSYSTTGDHEGLPGHGQLAAAGEGRAPGPRHRAALAGVGAPAPSRAGVRRRPGAGRSGPRRRHPARARRTPRCPRRRRGCA